MATPLDAIIPATTSVQTFWNAPWVIHAISEQGLKHYDQNTPCEDAYAIGGTPACSWIVVSDGVSTEPQGRMGALRATHAVSTHLANAMSRGEAPGKQLLLDAYAAAHAALKAQAHLEKRELRHFAATLATTILTKDTIVAANLGDSSVVGFTRHLRDGQAVPRLHSLATGLQPPPGQRGTYTIANEQWSSATTVRETSSPHIDAVLLATDGGQSFFMQEPDHESDAFYTPFMEIFTRVAEEKDGRRRLIKFASSFLEREKNLPNSRDDRTIVIAHRQRTVA